MSENSSNPQSPQSKQPKKITFGMVCSFIFGIIFIFSSIGTLSSSILSAIIYLLLGIFILPPLNKIIVEKSGIKLGGFVVFIVCLVLAGVAGSIYSNSLPTKNPELVSNQNSSQSAGQSTQSQNSQKPTSKIVPFATEMKLGEFTIMIDKVDFLSQIESGNQFINNYKPTNKVLSIRISGVNNAKEEKFVSISGGLIETKDGYKFKQLDSSKYLTIGTAQQISESELEKGFKGCLGCGLPPLGKAKEYMFFDIPEKDLSELTLTFKDYQFALQ